MDKQQKNADRLSKILGGSVRAVLDGERSREDIDQELERNASDEGEDPEMMKFVRDEMVHATRVSLGMNLTD